MAYIIGFCYTWTMLGHCPNFGKSLLVAARADLGAPPVCPLVPPQFVHSPLPSFSSGFLCFDILYFSSTAQSYFQTFSRHPMYKIGHILSDWLLWEEESDRLWWVEEGCVVINAAEDTKYDWLLFCAIFFPISHNDSPNFSQLQVPWKPCDWSYEE